jgi:hypothetical protein
MRSADHPKYDFPPGLHPPPLYERTRRWGPGPSRSQSPGPRRSRSHSNFPPGRERVRRRNLTPPPRALPRDDDTRRSISPYSGAEAGDPTVQRRAHGRRVRSRSRSPTRTHCKGKGRASSSRSPSPLPQTDEVTAHHERTSFSEVLETPAKSLRSPSLDSEIHHSGPSTSRTPSLGTRPREESLPSPGDDNLVTPPLPHDDDGSAGPTHSIERAPSPSESRQQPFNLDVTGPSIKAESYDPPTINDNPARSNPARRHRYRNQRDSIIAYLRTSSSTSTPRFPTSIQPALPLPGPQPGIADAIVTGIDGLGSVASTTNRQGGSVGSYAGRRPAAASAVNDYSPVRKEETTTRAQSSGGFPHHQSTASRRRALNISSASSTRRRPRVSARQTQCRK